MFPLDMGDNLFWIIFIFRSDKTQYFIQQKNQHIAVTEYSIPADLKSYLEASCILANCLSCDNAVMHTYFALRTRTHSELGLLTY